MKLSTAQLALATVASNGDAVKYVDPINVAMERFYIDSPLRVSAFLATVAIESARLTRVEEDLYYKSAERLASIYPRAFKTPADAQPYTRNPAGLGKILYAGYWGRGLIQLTWMTNYQRASNALGFNYVSHPELVCQPTHAALTAAWFWHQAGCNTLADEGDMDEITRRVNGPRKMHLEERTAQYAANVDLLRVA